LPSGKSCFKQHVVTPRGTAAVTYHTKASDQAHVFATVARNDAGLRWTAVTIDNEERRQRRARPCHHSTGCTRSHRADRNARSSIIVSDEPLSREIIIAPGSYNQPLGGFVVRAGRRLMLPLRGQFLERRRQWQRIWFFQLIAAD
jgi:hypothetical protein